MRAYPRTIEFKMIDVIRIKQTRARPKEQMNHSEKQKKERGFWMLWEMKKKHFCGSLNLKRNIAFLQTVFVELVYHAIAKG